MPSNMFFIIFRVNGQVQKNYFEISVLIEFQDDVTTEKLLLGPNCTQGG